MEGPNPPPPAPLPHPIRKQLPHPDSLNISDQITRNHLNYGLKGAVLAKVRVRLRVVFDCKCCRLERVKRLMCFLCRCLGYLDSSFLGLLLRVLGRWWVGLAMGGSNVCRRGRCAPNCCRCLVECIDRFLWAGIKQSFTKPRCGFNIRALASIETTPKPTWTRMV